MTGQPSQRINPDAQTLAQIKIAALAQLAKAGLVRADEIPTLIAGPCDKVLDRTFVHCACIRVRCANGQELEIYPGDTLQ